MQIQTKLIVKEVKELQEEPVISRENKVFVIRVALMVLAVTSFMFFVEFALIAMSHWMDYWQRIFSR